MFKHDYTIYPNNSIQKFKEACDKIQGSFPNAIKDHLLVDVDGSTIQVFNENDNKIVIYDDYDVGAVYIKSDVDLKGVI